LLPGKSAQYTKNLAIIAFANPVTCFLCNVGVYRILPFVFEIGGDSPWGVPFFAFENIIFERKDEKVNKTLKDRDHLTLRGATYF